MPRKKRPMRKPSSGQSGRALPAAIASLAGTATAGAASSAAGLGRKQAKRKSSSSSSTAVRPSRLQPSVPMHMTTRRRASKSASMNSASPSDASRGNSITRQSTIEFGGVPDDLDVQPGPPKRRRLTDQHAPAVRPSTPKQAASTKADSDDSNSSNLIASLSSDDPSPLKRKLPDGLEDGVSVSSAAGLPEDAVESGNAHDATPEPPRKRLRGRQPRLARPKNSTAPVSEANDLEMAPIVPVKRPPGRPRRGKGPVVPRPNLPKSGPRLAGRRRANLDAQLEADLLRQAALKKNYRALVRALKPALYELGERTQKELEDDERAHERYAQHEIVQKELDRRLAAQLACIEAEFQLKKDQRATILRAQRAIIEEDLQRQIKDIQDDHVATCKADYLKILGQMRAEFDGEATDDEDATAMRRDQTSRMVDGTSRSLSFLQTSRSWEAVETRARVKSALTAYAPALVEPNPEGFVRYDAGLREAAIADENVERLTDAVAAVDAEARRAEAEAVANERRYGLGSILEAIKVHTAEASKRERREGRSQSPSTPLKPTTSASHPAPHQDQHVVQTPRRAPRNGVGRNKHISPTKAPVTPEHRIQRGSLDSQISSQDATTKAKAPADTGAKRTEPKLGFFSTPKSIRVGSPESNHHRRNLAPIDTSTPTHRQISSAKESPSRPRILAPKRAGEVLAPPRPSRTNSLASILNFDEPDMGGPRKGPPRAHHPDQDGPPYLSSAPAYHPGAQLPPLPSSQPIYHTQAYHSMPQRPPPYEPIAGPPRPYQGYELSGPMQSPASLPPQPPLGPPPPPPPHYGSSFSSYPVGATATLPAAGALPPLPPLHPASMTHASGSSAPMHDRPYYDGRGYWNGPEQQYATSHGHSQGPGLTGMAMEPGGYPRQGSIVGLPSALPPPPPPPPPPPYSGAYNQYPPHRG